MTKFVGFGKIPRLSRDCIITEKLDGTNAQVAIFDETMVEQDEDKIVATVDGWALLAGSRNRYITPENDNFGFAAWVRDNAEELVKLGEGRHFGEWWGMGIQRRYGLDERRFSLFNTSRWSGDDRPACCHVVPVLYDGAFDTVRAEGVVTELRDGGSRAAPGFMDPEGIMVYHLAGNVMFKKTIKDDHQPKGQSNG